MFLQRLDPRTKLVLTALFSTLIFMVDVLPVAAAQALCCIGLCAAAKIPPAKMLSPARFLLPLIALIMALQILFGRGWAFGLMISCRVIALSALMPLLVMTTDMQALARALTRMGIPYRAAFVITATLNLIPLFEEDARMIIDARRLRGVRCLESGNVFKRLGEYPAVALPLLIKALRQAHLMALAMDSRAFGVYKTRTWLRETFFSARDYGAFAAGALWFGMVIGANSFLKG